MSGPNHDLDFLSEALTSGTAADPSSECPAPELFWNAARGRLAPAELGNLAEHAAECPDCAHELRAARRSAEELGELPLAAADRAPGDEPQATVFDAVSQHWRGFLASLIRHGSRPALAAAAVAAAVLAVVLIPDQDPALWAPPGQARIDSEAQEVLELFIENGQTLSRREFVVRWQALEGARYDATLMTEELDQIAHASELKSAEWRVSAQRLRSLPDHTFLLFQVEAYRPDGGRIVSRTYRIRLAP